MFLFLFAKKKLPAIKLVVYTLFALYIDAVLKMIYAQPRPYQAYAQIFPLGECPQDFGRPSGHAMVGLVLYACIYWLCIHRQNEADFEEESKYQRHLRIRNVTFVLTIALIFCIGLSRVYLGVHSFGQVLLGWSYGIIFMVLAIYFFDKTLDNIIEYLVVEAPKFHRVCKVTAVHLSLVLVSSIMYLSTATSINYGPWYQAITEKCNVQPTFMLTFFESNFRQTGLITVVFGFFYGLLLMKKIEENLPKSVRLCKDFSRVLIFATIALTIFILFRFFSTDADIWVIYYFQDMPILLLLTIGFAPILLSRIKFSKEDEFQSTELTGNYALTFLEEDI